MPTGLDSAEPRCRKKIEKATIEPTASSSDCQFCSVRFQKSAESTRLSHRYSAITRGILDLDERDLDALAKAAAIAACTRRRLAIPIRR